MSYRHVRVEGGRPVGRLTLDRPPMNGLDPEVMGEIMAAVSALERDPAVRAIVVDSACRAFSAGGDFASWRSLARSGRWRSGTRSTAISRAA